MFGGRDPGRGWQPSSRCWHVSTQTERSLVSVEEQTNRQSVSQNRTATSCFVSAGCHGEESADRENQEEVQEGERGLRLRCCRCLVALQIAASCQLSAANRGFCSVFCTPTPFMLLLATVCEVLLACPICTRVMFASVLYTVHVLIPRSLHTFECK